MGRGLVHTSGGVAIVIICFTVASRDPSQDQDSTVLGDVPVQKSLPSEMRCCEGVSQNGHREVVQGSQ